MLGPECKTVAKKPKQGTPLGTQHRPKLEQGPGSPGRLSGETSERPVSWGEGLLSHMEKGAAQD